MDSHYESYKTRHFNLVASDIYNASIHYVPAYKVRKHEEALNMHHDAFLSNGYEGSILRDGLATRKQQLWAMKLVKVNDQVRLASS